MTASARALPATLLGVFVTEDYVFAWLRAFVFTQVVEMPIYRRALPAPWTAAFGASAITHPFVWFFFPWIALRFDVSWYATATASEIFAWLVEAAWFVVLAKRGWISQVGDRPRMGWPRAVVVSLAANAASLGLGLVSRWLFGMP